MIRLRPFKLSDSDYISKWLDNEISLNKWCAGQFKYPLTAQQITDYYHKYESDSNAWLMTALNEEGIPVGHFMMCKADYINGSIYLAFVVLDTNLRGKGCGKEMLSQAIKYAFDILSFRKVTLRVFENNAPARKCYTSVGFVDEKYSENFFQYGDEKWGIYDMTIEKSQLSI